MALGSLLLVLLSLHVRSQTLDCDECSQAPPRPPCPSTVPDLIQPCPGPSCPCPSSPSAQAAPRVPQPFPLPFYRDPYEALYFYHPEWISPTRSTQAPAPSTLPPLLTLPPFPEDPQPALRYEAPASPLEPLPDVEEGQHKEGTAETLPVAEEEKPREKRLTKKCSNEELLGIMNEVRESLSSLQSISEDLVESKLAIAWKATQRLGGLFDVVCPPLSRNQICSRGSFSYLVNARSHCELGVRGVTCFVFRHEPFGRRRR